jgi:hypothetical protein
VYPYEPCGGCGILGVHAAIARVLGLASLTEWFIFPLSSGCHPDVEAVISGNKIHIFQRHKRILKKNKKAA